MSQRSLSTHQPIFGAGYERLLSAFLWAFRLIFNAVCCSSRRPSVYIGSVRPRVTASSSHPNFEQLVEQVIIVRGLNLGSVFEAHGALLLQMVAAAK